MVMRSGIGEIRELRQREIEQRIELVASEVLLEAGLLDDPCDLRPRWISAAELVRRMQPYLSLN
jgi:hypothetical protein